MVLIRPVRASDLAQLEDLASLAGVGLTTLPKDRDLLARRIHKSEMGLAKLAEQPGGETYLFVLEDLDTSKVVGASGIVSKVGGFQPFYSYNVERILFHSDVIDVHKEVPTLVLKEDHDGPCEVGSLFLHPDYRHGGNGRLLQLVRFLFIAEHPHAFETTVVSEIRGISDATGNCPFWDAVGRHFFDIDFSRADYLSIVNKKFIADLFPDHPIYIPLLPKSAQDVIGKPHPDSARAVTNLEAEGFKFSGMVDIFDAGPVLSCPRDQIRAVRDSRTGVVAEVTGKVESEPYMIGTSGADFRAVKGTMSVETDGSVRLPRDCAKALGVRIGDSIRFATLRAPGTAPI
jgi:arginine N-succinyltransferase